MMIDEDCWATNVIIESFIFLILDIRSYNMTMFSNTKWMFQNVNSAKNGQKFALK